MALGTQERAPVEEEGIVTESTEVGHAAQSLGSEPRNLNHKGIGGISGRRRWKGLVCVHKSAVVKWVGLDETPLSGCVSLDCTSVCSPISSNEDKNNEPA